MKTQRNTTRQNERGNSKSTSRKIHSTKRAQGKPGQLLTPEQLVDIIEHMNDGVVVLDKNWHYIYVNQKAAVMLQRQKPSDLIGKHIWTEYPEGVGQPFQVAYEKAMRDQTPIVFEDHYEPWDLWFENRIYPLPESLLILFTEITDRKRIEQLLNERQHFLQTILDTEPGIVYLYDMEERRNVYVNRFWPLTFGYTQEETQGMDEELLGRIIHPDDLPRITKHHEDWMQAGEYDIRTIEYQIRTKSGDWRWLYSREVPFLLDPAGRVKQILGITQDITERKRAEEEVQEQNRFISALAETTPGLVYVYDWQTGSNVYSNSGYEFLLGYTSDEVKSMGTRLFAQLLYPDDGAAVVESQERLASASDKDILEIDYRLRHSNGEWRWLRSYERPFARNKDGSLKQKIGIAIDITERKQTEEALAASEAELRALFASMNDVVLVIDCDGVYQKIAPTNPNLLYKPPEELLGKTLRDVFPPEQAEAFIRTIRQVVETRQTAHIEYPLLINERVVWFDASISPMEAENTLWMARDITDRKRAEGELRQLNEELEQHVAVRTEQLAAAMIKAQEADRLKSTFLATMSHELRTPLNSIIGFTGVILQEMAGPINEEQTKQLNMIRDSARHLLALINDVLDISKIEAGQLEILKRPFDMRHVVESVLRVMQPLAQKKNLALLTFIGSGVGTINNDRRRVEQVLINLVGNSIKFTERGEVSIRCQIRNGWLETSVHDDGIGIKPEDLGRLFKPFQQIDTGLSRGHEGTGLGLAICKRLVSAMGGEISVESRWGAGSTFKFTLPI